MIKKNKTTIILTSLLVLLPMVFGLAMWNRLPETMPLHMNIAGVVDGWSSKALAVFMPPLLLLQREHRQSRFPHRPLLQVPCLRRMQEV